MSFQPHYITGVPTNIVTGFLGAGKTSTILHLLSNKPPGERWAVLVNEFGEIGIDGSLFKGHHTTENGVYIREVPGGCMCCTAGLPMQVALNQLLKTARPDRLLIEPTGLGHPEEVVQTLTGHSFKEVLLLQKIVTLVDARKISDPRYSEHETFIQQVGIADTIIGNKQDLYQEGDRTALREYVDKHGMSTVDIIFTQHGAVAAMFLEGSSDAAPAGLSHLVTEERLDAVYDEPPVPDNGFISITNEGSGFKSIGWRFASNQIFDRTKLFALLSGIIAERLKAVFITENGTYGYNLTSDALTEIPLENCDESRIEIISTELNDEWGALLLECLVQEGC